MLDCNNRALVQVPLSMKNTIATTLLFSMLALYSPATAADRAPDWSLTSPGGKVTRLSDEVQNQPVVILFWASWCPYCKALMPHLQSIHHEYGSKIKILAVSFRDKGDPSAYLEEAGYDFTMLPNGDDVAALYDVYGTPGIIIIDQKQRIRFDLTELPPYVSPRESDQKMSHRQKAAYRAPYWAAVIRQKIDNVLAAGRGR